MSRSSFEKKEKAMLLNFARTVGLALGTVAAKTSAATKPARRRKSVRVAKAQVKKQVRKAGKQVKQVARKVRSSARKASRNL